jgi:ChpA-C
MSLPGGCGLVGRRLWSVGLAGAVLAAAAVVPSGAVAASPGGVGGGSARAGRPPLGATPDQVINAQKDPDAAAQALQGCADISNCSLAHVSVTGGYGPPAILGDVLYNCNPPGGSTAYTAASISDTRGETTSVSEKLSLKLQGGLIGIASTSLEAWVSSTQAQTFSTTVTTTSQVTVPPGYKGFTTTQVLSANATASYYITRGIHLIEVTGIDMTFPGYQDNQHSGDAQVIYNGVTQPINPVINLNYETIPPCNAVNDNPSTGLGGVRPKFPTSSFKLTFCPPRKRCVTRTLQGPPPPKVRRATAILSRRGRTYATGTDIRGRIRLKGRRKIPAGKYRLIIRQKPRKMIVRQNGRRLHTAEQHIEIHIPINVCGNTVGPVSGLNPQFGNSCQNAKP